MSRLEKKDSYRWTVMAIVGLGTFMAALNTSVINVSLPAIMADLGADMNTIEWIITGYMIAMAALMPLTAWFRDHIGYKKVFVLSLAVFTAGSFMCGIAWSTASLITARVFQALGGGAITPTGMAMIAEVFPREERGKAIGILSMGAIVGPAIGPTLGGYLTNAFGWRSIFLINLPLGAFAVVAGWMLLRNDMIRNILKKPFDSWGFVSFTAFLVPFLVALSQGEKEGWTSAFIVWSFIISAVSFAVFLLVETHIDYGVIDLSLFRSKVYTACMVISAVRSIILYGGMILIPLFTQQQMGYDELSSGLLLMPGSIVMALCMPFGGKIGDRIGAKIPALIGLSCLGMFMFMYGDVQPVTSVGGIIAPTIVRGIGMALIMAPISAAALNAVPLSKASMASSMLSIMQQIGGSIGIVVFTTMLTNRTHYHLSVVGAAMKSGSPAFSEAILQRAQDVHSLGLTHAESFFVAKTIVMKAVSSSAVVMAFQDAFLVGGVIAAVCLIPAWFLHGRTKPHVKPIVVQEEVLEETTNLD